MLFEMQVDALVVGGVSEFEENFGRVVEKRTGISPLIGFFHAEIGDLNRVMHIWSYESAEARAQIQDELARQPWWPPANAHLILGQAAKLMSAAPFRPDPLVGALGPVYEFRTYTIKPGRMNELVSLWRQNLSSREELSPLAACFTTEAGPLNQFIHVWVYRDLNHRAEVRIASRKLANWHLGREFMVSQNVEVWMPASFSPMH